MISVFDLCNRNDTALGLKFVLKGVINKYLGFEIWQKKAFPPEGRKAD